MFSRILFTALFISILNEACHAEPLLGCRKFSDHKKKDSPANEQEIVAIINSNITTDISFMSVGIAEFRPAMLLLQSCEKGAKALNVLNKKEFRKKADEYMEQTKHNITIDFKSLENNCIQIADIKERLQKIIYPNQTKPAVYIHLSSKKATDKKAIKSPTKGQFLLLDDCATNTGAIVNHSVILNLIQTLANEVQEAAVIEFPEEELPCLSYVNMSTIIFDSLTKKYKDKLTSSTDLKTALKMISKPDVGKNLVYRDERFNQVNNCGDLLRNPLLTATQLDDVLNEIAKNEITRFEDELNKI